MLIYYSLKLWNLLFAIHPSTHIPGYLPTTHSGFAFKNKIVASPYMVQQYTYIQLSTNTVTTCSSGHIPPLVEKRAFIPPH
jgi:hypothetical protein